VFTTVLYDQTTYFFLIEGIWDSDPHIWRSWPGTAIVT
jgi:hypothetical protein